MRKAVRHRVEKDALGEAEGRMYVERGDGEAQMSSIDEADAAAMPMAEGTPRGSVSPLSVFWTIACDDVHDPRSINHALLCFD